MAERTSSSAEVKALSPGSGLGEDAELESRVLLLGQGEGCPLVARPASRGCGERGLGPGKPAAERLPAASHRTSGRGPRAWACTRAGDAQVTPSPAARPVPSSRPWPPAGAACFPGWVGNLDARASGPRRAQPHTLRSCLLPAPAPGSGLTFLIAADYRPNYFPVSPTG